MNYSSEMEEIFSSSNELMFDLTIPAAENHPYYFSQLFPLLFGGVEVGQGRKNLMSYFDAMCNLVLETLPRDPDDEQSATRILSGLQKADNGSAHVLISYSIQVYRTIKIEPDVRRNIFQFMTHFPFDRTRVVLMFHTPYALHGAITDTSKLVFSLLNEEMGLVERFREIGPNLKLSDADLKFYQQNVKFVGWINQGVLLQNLRLTKNDEIWDGFSQHFVRTVSDVEQSKVFILVGEAKHEDFAINKERHMVLRVYHPMAKRQPQLKYLWNHVLPFINTNFFIYQINQRLYYSLIDWTCITENDTICDHKRGILGEFFEYVLAKIKFANNHETKCSIPINKGNIKLNAVLMKNGRYILRQHTK